jgi:DNA-binding NtrC family response regulator
MVTNIIEQHNGFIKVYSEVGVGTRFMIYLPIISENNMGKDSIESIVYKGNNETILVADDEPIIREIVKNILDEANYKSIIVDNGFDAVKYYEAMQKSISLVLIDMSMPEMNGLETVKKMIEINPDVKAIICSGFKHDDIETQTNELKLASIVEKPFTLYKLSKVLYEVLNNS